MGGEKYIVFIKNEHITSSAVSNIVNIPPDDIHEKLLEGELQISMHLILSTCTLF